MRRRRDKELQSYQAYDLGFYPSLVNLKHSKWISSYDLSENCEEKEKRKTIRDVLEKGKKD